MKIGPEGAELFHTDRHDEVNNNFSQFCESDYSTGNVCWQSAERETRDNLQRTQERRRRASKVFLWGNEGTLLKSIFVEHSVYKLSCNSI